MINLKILSPLVSLILLASCGNIPEGLKSQDGKDPPDSAGTVSNSSIRNNITAGKRIGNLTFVCDPDPVETNDIYIFKSSKYLVDTELRPELPHEDYSELVSRLKDSAKELIDFELSDDKILIHGRRGEQAPATASRSSIVAEYMGYNDSEYYQTNPILAELYADSGNFDLYDFRGAEGAWPHLWLERKIYLPNDYPDEKYEMIDGTEMTVAEAVSQADDIVKKVYSLKLLDEDIGLRLSKIAVNKTDAGKNVINIRFRQERAGLLLNDDGYLSSDTSSALQVKFTYFDISFSGNGHLMMIRNIMSFKAEEKVKTDNIISYEEAQKRLAEGLAPNLEYTVTESGLRYCCMYSQNDEHDEFRPMWTFVLEDKTSEEAPLSSDDMGNLKKADPFQYYKRTMGYVDAVNGDLFYYNSDLDLLLKYG